MPERQSVPDGGTVRPGTEDRNGHAPAGVTDGDPTAAPESPGEATTQTVPEQAEAPPETPTASSVTASPSEGAPTIEATKDTGGTEPDRPGEASGGEQAPRPRPRPRPRPGVDTPPPGDTTDQEAAGTGSPPGKAGPEGDEATPVADNASAGAEAPTVRTPRPRSEEPPTVAVRAAAQPDAGGRPAPGRADANGAGTTIRPGGWDGERTHVLPRPGEAAGPPAQRRAERDAPTERIPMARSPHPGAAGAGVPATVVAPRVTTEVLGSVEPRHPVPVSGPEGRPASRRRRRLLILAVIVGVFALLYVGDLVLSAGSLPRGVTVVGVPVGGLGFDEAEQRLRAEIGPRATQPVAVTAGEVRSELDPTVAGLDIDWAGTVERAGGQPLNPITRIRSFFADREVGVVTTADHAAVSTALEQLGPVVDRPAVEGNVQFSGTTPTPVLPESGQQLDVPAAIDVLLRDWATGEPVVLPMTDLPPVTTPDDVTRAIDEVARPAVAGPVTVLGEKNARAVLEPEVIASALSFRADPQQGLVPELNQPELTQALKPQLAASEVPGRNATIDFSSGKPVIIPSQNGRGVDYDATLRDLLDVITSTGSREVTAVYGDQPAEVTTEELGSLGIKEVISEFTTGGFARDSGLNIRRAAEQINGMIVKPGETFSLNAATSPRNAANGYVEAGIISDGHPSRGIGGGVSQVATTLYNAAYFAGMVDVAHKEHSFYISRYPAGREATVFEGVIDLKFRNDTPTGVLIQTEWTPSSITVRLYGTKTYEVTSTPGPRTNPTPPNTVTLPPGEPCSPSNGAPGFTITDTRTIRNIRTGEIRTEPRTVRYNPSPQVICGG